jgi:Rieske Fe-S protein
MEKRETRREFILKIFSIVGFLGASLLFLRNILLYILPRIAPKKERKILVAREDELKVGEAKMFTIADKDFYIVRTEDGYKVFSAVCTHLGCKVKWETHNRRFYCPCHKGVFDMNGGVVSGPPPRPLDSYKVETAGKLVYMWLV